MTLINAFIAFVKKENLFSVSDTLLLAVSGGVDSVVLCELCQQAGYNFVIAHCNFMLRGQESNRDEQFVRNLAAKYGKTVIVEQFETAQYAVEKKVSIQVAARELRYQWFYNILNNKVSIDNSQLNITGPKWLVTAHHQDDNVETLLMNFFKGTGIAGLRGILPKQQQVIRPLLFAKKNDLSIFAEQNNLQWVEDSSNTSDKYSRNYFRNQLIPHVQNVYAEAESNIADNIQRFKEIEVLYAQAINQHKNKLLIYKESEIHISVLKLKKVVPLTSIVYEIIKEYQFSVAQTQEVIQLLNSETGKYIASATHRIIKNRNWLIIAPLQTTTSTTFLIEEGMDFVDCGIGRLEITVTPNKNFSIPSSIKVACLHKNALTFPLLLRKWKEGDYFYPLGMKKKKKIARFLIDQKTSKTDKEKVWVLEANKKIVWIVGYRIDDRFKITPNTKEIMQVNLKTADV